MICKQCGKDMGPSMTLVRDICLECTNQNFIDGFEIDRLIYQGHTRHCAERQVWGDGECSCELETHYDPYWWTKTQFKVPFTTA